MREMKDSGVEWIGEIPVDWKLSKIGSVYDERNEKVSDKDFVPLSVTKQGIVPQLETAAKTDNGDNRKLIRKDDFVINSRSDRRGSCGISEYEGSCSLINTVLKPQTNMCNRYYGFVFKSDGFADEYYRWGHGIVDDLWSTKWIDMKSIYIPEPDITEQERIADYLDAKCSKIDEIIEKQQAIIEKLKEYKFSIITEAVTKGINPDVELKDSTIDMCEQIPVHWSISQNRYVFSLRDEKNYKSLEEVRLLSLYTDLGVFPHGEQEERGNKAVKAEGYKVVYENDIVVNIILAWMGAIGRSAYDGVTSPAYDIYKPNENVCSRYYHYLYRTKPFSAECYKYGRGIMAMRWRTYSSEFKSIKVPVPPYIEQCQIADYLDSKCEMLDKTIADRNKAIDKLQEYKKSLIYEVVTGKKEV